MRVDLFDFDLPEDRIALRPASPRDAARLLVVRPDGEPLLEDRAVRDLPDLLRAGDVLVFNDTRVIPARLHGVRARGEATAARRGHAAQARAPSRWRAFARPAKRLAVGDRIRFGEARARVCVLGASTRGRGERRGRRGRRSPSPCRRRSSTRRSRASATCRCRPTSPASAPPDERDRADYQTRLRPRGGRGRRADRRAAFHRRAVCARSTRAASAGTSSPCMSGAGTFLPVKAEDTAEHRMHAEWGEVVAGRPPRRSTPRAARGGRIVAVGTTSLRLLESAAARGRHDRAVRRRDRRSSSRPATASAPSTC